jgi:hypothetical protein
LSDAGGRGIFVPDVFVASGGWGKLLGKGRLDSPEYFRELKEVDLKIINESLLFMTTIFP